jgi:hypothetical protein
LCDAQEVEEERLMPPPEDSVEVRLAQLSAQLAALQKSLTSVERALIMLIESDRKRVAFQTLLEPVVEDIRARFVKDGKLKLPGLFS